MSSTVASWTLARRFRSYRLERELPVRAIADALKFSANYWSAVENDRTKLADDKFEAALDFFGISSQERFEMTELRAMSKTTGWWDDYTDLLPDDILRLYGLEDGASTIRVYESSLVTGLLQNDEYALNLIRGDPSVRPADRSKLLEIRLARQRRLREPDAVRLVSVMSEAALLQSVGPPSVLSGELRHLVDLIEDDTNQVEVHVFPFSSPPGGAGGSSTLFLLDFDEDELPTVAWQEAMFPVGITEDREKVDFLRICFDHVLEGALSPEDSVEMIKYYAARSEG
jgi:transcriptional regulator with XRE-family HTH domain